MTLKECFFLFLWEHPNVIITKLKTNTYKVHMRRALFWVSYSHHASYTCGHLIWRAMPCAGSIMTLQRPTPLLFCIFLDAHSVLHHKPKQDLNAIYNFQSRPRRKMEKYIHKDLHFRVLYKSSLLPPPANLSYKLSPEFGAHWKRQSRHRKGFRGRMLFLTHVSRPLWLFTKLLTNKWVFSLGKILLQEFGRGMKYLSCHLIPCHACGLDCYSFFPVAFLGSNYHFVQ